MKKYSFLPILALVLGIAASAFTTAKNSSIEKWHFIENSPLSAAKTASAYEADMGTADCDQIPTVPCVVEFDNTVYPTLQDYLDQFQDPEDVLDEASEVRSQ